MTKVLILGGGFGGVRCALDLNKKFKGQAQITLVDRNSFHLFLPSLYEVASIWEVNQPTGGDSFAVKIRKTVCIPYGDIFIGKNINFIQAEISTVDLGAKNISTKGGKILSYDYLIIALGSQTADFGIPGVKEYAFQFKSIDDAVAINMKIGKLIKKMASGEKMNPLRILIGGAGFTGIEFAAEISCHVKKICHKHNVDAKNAVVTLIEAGSKILPMISDSERKIISKRLTELGVVLMENSPIGEVNGEIVKLKNGQILEGDILVWTAGIKANEFLKTIVGLPLTSRGEIAVNSNLMVLGFKNVFAIGDNQGFLDPKTQKPIPALAYMAVDQGKIVAKNIYNILNNKNLKHYQPFYGIWIAPVGGKFAMAHLWGGWIVAGLTGWMIRELVDLRYLISILTLKKGVSLFWQEVAVFTKND